MEIEMEALMNLFLNSSTAMFDESIQVNSEEEVDDGDGSSGESDSKQ